MVQTGQHGEFHWLVSAAQIWALTDLVVRFHRGLRLCITCFDSGPIRLSHEELAAGWSARGEVAVSPTLDVAVEIPHDQYEEWYLLSDPAAVSGAEVFVNYGGFSLAAPAVGLDCMAPIQDRFWAQLGRVRPESYVAIGDNDVIVSRDSQFIEAVQAAAELQSAPDTNRDSR
jgi:hypothetical protein